MVVKMESIENCDCPYCTRPNILDLCYDCDNTQKCGCWSPHRGNVIYRAMFDKTQLEGCCIGMKMLDNLKISELEYKYPQRRMILGFFSNLGGAVSLASSLPEYYGITCSLMRKETIEFFFGFNRKIIYNGELLK